jgi:hypothetical protein
MYILIEPMDGGVNHLCDSLYGVTMIRVNFFDRKDNRKRHNYSSDGSSEGSPT